MDYIISQLLFNFPCYYGQVMSVIKLYIIVIFPLFNTPAYE